MISLGINAFLVNYKNIKCYIHRTYSQGSPTLVPAPGSKTEMFYIISTEKRNSDV